LDHLRGKAAVLGEESTCEKSCEEKRREQEKAGKKKK
jgi:hypothetical protein